MTNTEWFYLLIGIAIGTFATLVTREINKCFIRHLLYKYVSKNETVFENSYVIINMDNPKEVSWFYNNQIFVLRLGTTPDKTIINEYKE